MNAFTNFGQISTDASGTVSLTHDNITDVSLFAECGSVSKAKLYDESGKRLDNYFGLRNSVTGEILDSPPVSRGYKIVNHALAFQHQADSVLSNPELPHDNLTIVDKVILGGRKATRSIFFNDLTWDIDGKSGGVTARADLINSTDMSAAFQIFAGAYRSYCENTLVFGGSKTYHQKQKHTANLSPEAMIAKAMLSLSMFDQHRELMESWKISYLDQSQWVEIMEATLCAKNGAGVSLSSDNRARVNGKLLDYMVHRFNQEVVGLGQTMWAGYNALTHWATHTNESFEKSRPDGSVVELQTGRSGSNQAVTQLARNEKIRKVLDSSNWLSLQGLQVA
jgi:hypothetical protein